MSVVVELSFFEMFMAANAGVMRQIEALKRGRPDRYGYDGDGWSGHIDGCLSECALAKARGEYWQPVVRDPKTLDGDVGFQQVRSTRRPGGSLIVHREDPDSSMFWLVLTGDQPRFTIAGSLLGGDAKRDEWWRTDTGRPAFFVPQSALTPLPLGAL